MVLPYVFFFFHLEVNLLISISSPEVGWSSKLICCLWETCSDLISTGTMAPSLRNSDISVCLSLKGGGTKTQWDIWWTIQLWKVLELKIGQPLSLFSSEVQTRCSIYHRPRGECWSAEPFLGHFWEFDGTSCFLCCANSRITLFSI